MKTIEIISIKELAVTYAMKDSASLRNIFKGLEHLKENIDIWFTNYNNSYSNSVMMKASYESAIRQPYNEKFKEYEELMMSYRLCKYYIEELS